jgi:hypothetical protein
MKKRRSISVTTPAINAFGTAVPSLNRRGKSNSKRQYALIGGRAIDGERNPLTSHRTKSLLRHIPKLEHEGKLVSPEWSSI